MSTGGSGRSVSLSARLAKLFDEVRNKETGRQYNPREVEDAIGELVAHLPPDEQKNRTISHTYLWQLKRGYRDNPTLGHLQSLAEFFGVPTSYFTDTGLSEAEVESQALLAAGLRDETIRQIMVRLVRADAEARNLVLNLVTHFDDVRHGGAAPQGPVDGS
jgi:transcriptional regulator with XRE-family HTH domain